MEWTVSIVGQPRKSEMSRFVVTVNDIDLAVSCITFVPLIKSAVVRWKAMADEAYIAVLLRRKNVV